MADVRQAWDRFYASVDDARRAAENTQRFREYPELSAQIYPAILEAQAMAYHAAVVPRRHRQSPRVYWNALFYDDATCLGTPIQDFRYGTLYLDGRRTYRLKGRIAEAKLLLMQVHSHLLGDPASEEIGNYDFQDFELGENGSFEITVSAEEHKGNWIRLSPDSSYNFLLVRAIMGDWSDELSTLTVEAIEPGTPVDDPDEEVAQGLAAAEAFFRYLVDVYIVGLYDIYIRRAGGQKNQWVTMPGAEVATSLVGSQSTTYVPGVYEIMPDEALIIEWQPPDSDYWSVELGDIWSRPSDFMNKQTDVNMTRARIDPDGVFRAVISPEDHGFANWLDPNGNLVGVVVMRNYRSRSETVAPSLTRVKAAELADHLPSDTARVSAEQRRKDLAYRRRATEMFFNPAN